MDSKAAGATAWVLDDTEMKELRGSLHSLETIAVLLSGFDSGAAPEGLMGDIAELIDRELRRVRGAIDSAKPRAKQDIE